MKWIGIHWNSNAFSVPVRSLVGQSLARGERGAIRFSGAWLAGLRRKAEDLAGAQKVRRLLIFSRFSHFPGRATGTTFALSRGALRINYGHARSARASARCGGKMKPF